LTQGDPQQEGARRPRREAEEEVWGQLTARGADEAFAAGRRLESWLAEQTATAVDDGDEEVEQELHTTVITSPTQRAMLTARAVVSALLPGVQRADAAQVRLRLATRALRVDQEAEDSAGDDEHAKQDVALDLAELLGQDPQAFEGASWARLLDVAECTETFGLLPKGQLTEATWQAVLSRPRQAAMRLADTKAVDRLAPLLRLSLEPCLRWRRLAKTKASRDRGHERLRLLVLPGFSLLCWAAALDLPRFAQTWPSPASNFLVETLLDEADAVFLRIWRMRDYLELKPKWHQDAQIRSILCLLPETIKQSARISC